MTAPACDCLGSGAVSHSSGASLSLCPRHSPPLCGYCVGTGRCDYRSSGAFYSPVPNTPGGEHECQECDAADDLRADASARDALEAYECNDWSRVVPGLGALVLRALAPVRASAGKEAA